jgi:hypothetical protein
LQKYGNDPGIFFELMGLKAQADAYIAGHLLEGGQCYQWEEYFENLVNRSGIMKDIKGLIRRFDNDTGSVPGAYVFDSDSSNLNPLSTGHVVYRMIFKGGETFYLDGGVYRMTVLGIARVTDVPSKYIRKPQADRPPPGPPFGAQPEAPTPRFGYWDNGAFRYGR